MVKLLIERTHRRHEGRYDHRMPTMIRKSILLMAVVAAYLTAGAQSVIVKDTLMTTYPFGDPNPIPQVKRNCYPYCNFEQFTTTPVQQTWKMVVLAWQIPPP